MSKKRGDVAPHSSDVGPEGVPLEQLAQPITDAPEQPRPDPFRGKRGGGDPASRARYWWTGLDPSNGVVRILWHGKTKVAAYKWMAAVRMLLTGTWDQVCLVRVKPVQPATWSE